MNCTKPIKNTLFLVLFLILIFDTNEIAKECKSLNEKVKLKVKKKSSKDQVDE